MPISGPCTNTRDNNPNQHSCASQISSGNSCRDYLRYKDCDKACNLCPCSTGKGTEGQHCSGHGTCQAWCNKTSCSSAKCICNPGWTGAKCEIYGRLHKNGRPTLF